jgi:DNA-binding NarL/FixJ family response regulator
MTTEEGVVFAVEDEQPPKTAPAAKPRSHALLTHRQLDVARHVADCLTNKQIADRLFLSERPIETHITKSSTSSASTPGPRSAAGWPAGLNEPRAYRS